MHGKVALRAVAGAQFGEEVGSSCGGAHGGAVAGKVGGPSFINTACCVCFPWLQLGSSLTLNTPCTSPEEMAAEWTFMNEGERAYHLTLIKRDHGVSQ